MKNKEKYHNKEKDPAFEMLVKQVSRQVNGLVELLYHIENDMPVPIDCDLDEASLDFARACEAYGAMIRIRIAVDNSDMDEINRLIGK